VLLGSVNVGGGVDLVLFFQLVQLLLRGIQFIGGFLLSSGGDWDFDVTYL